MEKEKLVNQAKGYFSNFKNLKKNFQTIKNNPYAFQRFQYYFTRLVLIIVGLVVTFQIMSMIISYSSGNGFSPMTLLTRAVMLLVMGIFIFKLYGMNKTYKKLLLHYEQFPSKTVDNSFNDSGKDLNTEIDDILNKYDDKGQLKGGNT